MAVSRGTAIIVAVVAAVVVFVVGFLGGFYGRRVDKSSERLLDRLTREADENISEKLINEINAENIRENLRHLTAVPHLAGTPADRGQAQELVDFWLDVGLDRAQLYPYDVLLSYPNVSNPNTIVLHDEVLDTTLFESQRFEKILRPEQNHSDVVPPFNAFSPPGQPKGDLVYVNYARVEDFIHITEVLGIDVTGYICIARYGKIFRGDKATFAARAGCIGLILYSDPADYALDGADVTYPESWFLPGTGVQRGSLFLYGDPLTPGYPSIESAYRIPESSAGLPTIPVQPIGYDDAQVFLSNMTGPIADEAWTGKLNITYKLGPGFVNSEWKAQMLISTHTKNVTTYNAMGFIRGAIEPDRYVLVGNHRDAWVFGSLDPSSGTAAMMEMSRAMGKLMKEGWRPRRTIVFCSWGAEEHGLVGSREWVEHFGKLLGERSIAYINVDIAVQGNFTFRGRSMPLMFQLMYDVAKKIPNPNPSEVEQGRPTVYDTWARNMPQIGEDGEPTGLPNIIPLGSGSDFAPFVSKLGVTSIDLRYHYDPAMGLSSYPMYHSVYETFHLVETFYDPDFSYHKSIAQIWGELARRLAEDYVLPFDMRQYGESMETYVKTLKDNYGNLMEDTGTDGGLVYLDRAVASFKNSIYAFFENMNEIDPKDPIQIRMMNDKMMQLDRMFIDPIGLPDRPLLRNVVFAPSSHNSYAGSVFPGLQDSLYELDRAVDEADIAQKAETVKQQLSVVSLWIKVAAASLLEHITW